MGKVRALLLRRPTGWAVLGGCLLSMLVYWPLLFGQALFFRDLIRWIYPARVFVRDALAQGSAPLWNPDVGLGFAVTSDPLYGLLYPGNWLYLLGRSFFWASFVAYAHMLWGGLGVALLARRLRCGNAGAALAAVTWGLSGNTTSLFTAGVLLNASAWVPWVALGFVRIATKPSIGVRDAALAAAPIGMALLLGEVFVALMAVGLGIGLALVAAVTTPIAERGTMRRRGALVVAALLVGTVAGSATVAPALASAGATGRRQSMSRELAEVGSFHPWRLAELAAPGMFGDPFRDYPGELVVGDPQLSNRPLTDSGYVGAGALVLACAALGRRRRLASGVAALGLLALLLALGKHTPVHDAFRALVRPFSYMRYPEKYLVLVLPCLALLAGLGLTRVLEERAAPWRAALPIAGVLFGLAAAAQLVLPAPVVPYARVAFLHGAVAALLVLGVVRALRRRPAVLAVALVALAGADLAWAARPLQSFTDPAPLSTSPPLADLLRADSAALEPGVTPRLSRSRVVEPLLQKKRPGREPAEVERETTATLASNNSAVFGVVSMDGYDAAVPEAFLELQKRGKREWWRAFRLLSVRYALVPIDEGWDRRAAEGGLVPLAEPFGVARLYRVPDPLPRVYLAGRAVELDDTAALDRVWADDVLAGGTVTVPPGSNALASGEGLAPAGTCRWEKRAVDALEAVCTGREAALAVFVEQWDPGWQATVDGLPAPILRANTVLRAVAVAAGEHRIGMRFRPRALPPALMATALAWLLIVAGCLATKLRTVYSTKG